MALPPTFVKGVPKPAPPKGGGHYVPHQGGFQLIHATGPGKWAPGAPGTKAPKAAPKGTNVNTGVYANPIYQPSKSLTGRDLAKAAMGLATAQTQGPLTELAQQIGANQKKTGQSEKAIAGYFTGLGNFAKQGVADQTKIANNLNFGLGMVGAGENQQLQGIGQQGQQALGQYTPGGASIGQAGGQSLVQEMARQQGLAAQNEGAFKQAGVLQGANQESLAASNLGSFSKSGQETLGKMAVAGQTANEPLTAKIAGLRAQKGALYSSDLGKLRQQEIANRYTAQGLGLKGQQLQLTAAQDAARNALTARGQNITAARDAATVAQNAARNALTARGQDLTSATAAANLAYRQAKGSGGRLSGTTKPLSAPQNGKILGQINKSVGMIREAQASFGKPGGAQRGAVRNLLAAKTGFPNYILDAAFQLVGYGALSPGTAAYLHSIGLRGGGYKVGAGTTNNAKGSLFGQPVSI